MKLLENTHLALGEGSDRIVLKDARRPSNTTFRPRRAYATAPGLEGHRVTGVGQLDEGLQGAERRIDMVLTQIEAPC
jgi:hypothetical protein